MTTSLEASEEQPRGDEDLLLHTDTNAIICTVAPRLASLLGFDPDDFIGRSAMAWIHEDDHDTATVVLGAIAETPSSTCSIRLRVRRHDGSHLVARCEVTHRPAGSSGAPVTVRVEPSRSLPSEPDPRSSERNESAAEVDVNPLAELVIDPSDGLLLSNHLGVQFLSPSLGRLLRRDAESLYESYGDLFHPDDQVELLSYIEALTSAQLVPARVKVRISRGDGTWGPYLLQTINLLDDPDFGLYFTFLHELAPAEFGAGPDITVEDDVRLRAALNRAANPVVVLGDEGQIRFISSPARVMFNRPVATMMAVPFATMLHERSLATWQAWIEAEARPRRVKLLAACDAAGTDFRWIEMREIADEGDDSADRLVVLVDIHDQVLAEQRLEARASRFAALVRNAPGGVIVVDESGTATGPAHSLEGVLGIRSDLVEGLRLVDWVDPDDRATLDDALRRAVVSSGAVEATVRQRIADGSIRHLSWTIEDRRDDHTVGGLVVNLFDRTEEVNAAAALRESERRFRALVSHSFEITAIVDDAFTVLWCSPSVTDLLGWEISQVIGQNAIDYLHPDDIDLVYANLEASLAGATPRPFTIARFRNSAGGWHHVVASASDRRDDPDVAGIIVNLRDAQDQVASAKALAESESRYRTLIQNSTDVVQIMSANARVLWVSPSVEHVLGWRPEQLTDEPVGSLSGLAGREDLVEAFLAVLREPGATARTVSQIQHADGTWRWVDVALTNQLDQPNIEGVVATYRDVTERIENDRALFESEERFRSLAESSPLGIFQLDLDQRCTYVNDRWCEITGQRLEQSLGDGWRESIRRGGNQIGELGADVDRYRASGPSIRLVRADGEARWCALHFAPLTDDQGDRIGSVGTIDDITATVEARSEARRLSTILQATPDLVVLFVPDGTLDYLNAAARAFFDVPDDASLRGTPVSDILPAENIELWTSQILPTLEHGQPWQGETTVRNRNGDVIPISAVVLAHRDPAGIIEMVSITARDMSERKALEARLQHQATHDPLTGLPNRTLLMDRLEMAMGRARRSRGRLAALFLDLDHFKVVNDSLGHGTGDELLKILADRLSQQVRPGDTVARFGGDEFVVVCEELEDEAEVEDIATRIAKAMAEPAWIGSSEVFVTASIGIALVDHLHHEPEQVLRDADAAMYQAKARGRARFERFDPRFRTRALERLEIENALRRALNRDELVVHYQPVFDLATDRVAGVEALLRWDHPDRKLLLPSEFLGVAEESGLIVPIGEWVLRTACRQARDLLETFGDAGRLDFAVNLSARQIADPFLVERITEIIATTEMDPAQLTFEITESILMDDVVQSNETLGKFKELGIGLAIDDFGTGYSSFAYLQRFPVDVLKVDRSFVSGLGSDDGDPAITEAIVTLSHTLGLLAVAEGVESEAQLEVLARIGCDRAQGFWKSRPLNAADLMTFLHERLD